MIKHYWDIVVLFSLINYVLWCSTSFSLLARTYTLHGKLPTWYELQTHRHRYTFLCSFVNSLPIIITAKCMNVYSFAPSHFTLSMICHFCESQMILALIFSCKPSYLCKPKDRIHSGHHMFKLSLLCL